MATLLLADDDPIVRYAYALLLRSSGYHVLEASSNENPDAVITDVNMPGMTALELSRNSARPIPTSASSACPAAPCTSARAWRRASPRRAWPTAYCRSRSETTIC